MDRVNFYDFKSNWSKFEKILESEEFITSVNIYHWWANNEQIGIDRPLIETERFLSGGINSDGDDKDIKYVTEKLIENFSTNNPYWFSYPGDCIELNNIITYTLLTLMFPEKDFYSTSIHLNDEFVFHEVIASKKINEVSNFTFDPSLVDENEGLILYDLIYPLCFWFGKTFETRENVTFIKIKPNMLTSEEWKGYNYISYFGNTNSEENKLLDEELLDEYYSDDSSV